MSRSFNEEWEKTEIPEDAYVRARNLAWARIQEKRPAASRKWAWAAATAAVATGLLLIPQWNRQEPKAPGIVRSEAPGAPEISRPEAPAPKVAAQVRPQSSRRASVKRPLPVATRPANANEEGPDRLVMNFVLPESGVKMIWILDKKFHLDGGQE